MGRVKLMLVHEGADAQMVKVDLADPNGGQLACKRAGISPFHKKVMLGRILDKWGSYWRQGNIMFILGTKIAGLGISKKG
jgi:hypothetical protein